MSATTDVACGCEHLWPSGVDVAACWWHGAGGPLEVTDAADAPCGPSEHATSVRGGMR